MLAVLGINYKTAPIHIRERFAISNDEIRPFSELVLQQTDINELVILSTCNRTEIYFYVQHGCCDKEAKELEILLYQFKKVSPPEEDVLYFHTEREAVKHLFQVTSGIDSLVIGEDQIVKQVKDAYVLCTKLALADAVLMRMFQKAFETGKKVRTQTAIQRGATSISLVAVEKSAILLDNIGDKKIMLVGMGDTNRIALQHLKKKGCSNFVFTNRTFAKAQQWAKVEGGVAVPFEDFKSFIPSCDLIITATSAGRILITKQDIEKFQQESERHRVLVDLSIPRNVSEDVAELMLTDVICIDDLEGVVSETRESRMESIAEASVIINQMVDEFYEWLDIRVLRPVIKTLTSNFKKVHANEMAVSKHCYTPEQYKYVEEYSARLTSKFTRRIIKKLKQLSISEKEIDTLNKVKDLFDFDNE